MKRGFRYRTTASGFTLLRPDGGSRLVATPQERDALVASALRTMVAAPGDEGERTPFWAVLAMVGVETEEGGDFVRMIEAVEPRTDFPLPLWWMDSSNHSAGDFALVGRIDEFHVEGKAVLATGSFDMALDAAQRAVAGMDNGAVAVSIDPSYPDEPIWECTELDPDDPSWCSRSRMRVPRASIGGATMCGLGAFPQARLSLTGYPEVGEAPEPPPAVEPAESEDDDVIIIAAAGEDCGCGGTCGCEGDERTVQAVVAALTLPTYRAEFFRCPPDLDPDTPLTVTPEGRVYGRAAPQGCHRGFPNSCQTPPADDDFGEFLLTPLTLDDGTRVMAGPLTFRGDAHVANPGLSVAAVRAAYDNTANVAGLVTMGRDEHGPWYSGVLRPDLSDDELWEITACGQVSGHWQPVGRANRLAALHIVPTPGFPQRGGLRQMQAVAASGAPVPMLVPGPEPLPYLMRQVRDLTREVATLRPLRELLPQAGDAVLASLNGR